MQVVQVMLWYLDSGCSKHMTGNRSKLMNFVEKFIGSIIHDVLPPSHNLVTGDPGSAQSSSGNVNAAEPNQLASDALWCCFHTELSRVEPKNFKMAVIEDCWDADHAGCQDSRRSTSGSAQFLGDRLVSWSSKKQRSMAILLASK
ncbi:retrovirus-related pol polyprotein from transposon TNT 1-94 [Tanacetum coccineum]